MFIFAQNFNKKKESGQPIDKLNVFAVLQLIIIKKN
jgi:hypothetical protein